jgi:sugar phosphate isomerase/epimerase
MRLALQTVSLGPMFRDFDAVAERIRSLGYEGVELGQMPAALEPASKLAATLHATKLTLAGLAGGSLQSRLAIAAELRPAYLYVDEWEPEAVEQAMELQLRLALHPHAYKPLGSLQAARRLLTDVPTLKLIVDVAHSYLADEDPIDAFEQHWPRIVAVHLKDWTHRYGRTPFRFARGFTALGSGQLGQQLDRVVQELKRRSFEGWLVVEQNTPHGDPLDCARESRDWLRDHGI